MEIVRPSKSIVRVITFMKQRMTDYGNPVSAMPVPAGIYVKPVRKFMAGGNGQLMPVIISVGIPVMEEFLETTLAP